MLNYRVQDGCHNCVHVFTRFDYGEEDTYFCTLNAPERPLCGALKMCEGAGSTLAKIRGGFDAKAWWAWASPRGVEHGGTCDAWSGVANLKADAETAEWYAKRALVADARVKELEAQLQATDARLENCQTARDNLREAREVQRQRIAQLESQLAAMNLASVPSCWANSTFCQASTLTMGGTGGAITSMFIDTLAPQVVEAMKP